MVWYQKTTKQFWLAKSVESNQLAELKLLIKYSKLPSKKVLAKIQLWTCVWLLSVQNVSHKIHPKSRKCKIPKLQEKWRSIYLRNGGGKYRGHGSLLFILYFVIFPLCRFQLISLQVSIFRKYLDNTLLCLNWVALLLPKTDFMEMLWKANKPTLLIGPQLFIKA